ncbi:MAG: type III pantothenate kinase [bacterium]|nr:type III pantothenate kinase [bacterium]
MLLAIDVGNTTTGIAVFKEDQIVSKNKLNTPDEVSVTFLKSLLKEEYRNKITDVIVSSVVPFVDDSLKESLEKFFHKKALFVDHTVKDGLRFNVDDPSELGADRIAGSVGGLFFFEPPFIILDSGTATTFDVISKDMVYLGGSIFPGVELSINSLAQNTAKLGRIHFSTPDSILGTSTETHIKAGIYYSYIGGLTYMIDEYKKIVGPNARVIATGGLIKHFKGKIEGIDLYEPDLLYYGLKKIFDIANA